jgi:hypothetical protein
VLEIRHRTVELNWGLNRRAFLQSSLLRLAGLSLPELLQARDREAPGRRRDTAVILYWMAGGPSQLETYDPKPAAPAEVRGPFKSVSTRVPGLSICELLPNHARLAQRFSLVRSLAHSNANHFDAAYWVQTGYHEPNIMGRGQPFPAQGAVVSHLRGPNRAGMPAYVCIPRAYSTRLGFYQQPAFLGANHGPINAGGEPTYRGQGRDPDFALSRELTLPRIGDRRQLLRHLDRLARETESNPAFQGLDRWHQEAFALLASPQVKRAFDLDQEPVALRERYGLHPWGRAALLARRLVESGVTFVTINHYEGDVDWWDDHYTIERNLRKRLPLFDQALATLIEDLHNRGLHERVLVVACGEFGRAPMIDKLAGRGHWPRAMSALISGGGTRSGQVVGATTPNAGEPCDRRLGPGDLLATIYRVLGIDPHRMIRDPQNRPVRLVDAGEPIVELL